MLSQKVVFVALLFVGILGLHGQLVMAQTETPKVELGASLSALRLSELKDTNVGVGGRMTFNLNRRVALEAEMTFFPGDAGGIQNNQTLGVFGVKAGQRWDKFGLFGKARPGFINFSKESSAVVCPAVFPSPLSCLLAAGRTEFAFDYGGVAEFYPSRGTVVRVDLGDTLIRYPGPFGRPNGGVADNLNSHNLQLNLGFGLRF
jgi:hypothetical protein